MAKKCKNLKNTSQMCEVKHMAINHSSSKQTRQSP
jgi:hypothetical protein